MPASPAERLVADLIDAYHRLDADRIVDAYANDARLEHAGLVMEGREEIRRYVQGYCASLEELSIERRHVAVAGNEIAVLVRIGGRFKRDMVASGVTWPTKGKSFDADLADFVTLDETGKIREETQLHDTLLLLGQLQVPADQLSRFATQMASANPVRR